MWILWKMRFLKSEFCEKWDFIIANFVKNVISEMWILWKMRFQKCEFFEKWDFKKVNFVKIGIFNMWIFWIKCEFLPQCVHCSVHSMRILHVDCHYRAWQPGIVVINWRILSNTLISDTKTTWDPKRTRRQILDSTWRAPKIPTLLICPNVTKKSWLRIKQKCLLLYCP